MSEELQETNDIVEDVKFEVTPPTIQVEQDTNKSLSEQAKDFVGVMATKKAVEDKGLVEDLTVKKIKEIQFNADANLKKEEADSKKADKDLQEANYGVYEGVANYAGIKKPLPQTMQKVLFSILSGLQMVFLILFGVPTSIINIIADCIDMIVKKLSSITKSAKWLVLALLVILIVYGGYLVITSLLRRYNLI